MNNRRGFINAECRANYICTRGKVNPDLERFSRTAMKILNPIHSMSNAFERRKAGIDETDSLARIIRDAGLKVAAHSPDQIGRVGGVVEEGHEAVPTDHLKVWTADGIKDYAVWRDAADNTVPITTPASIAPGGYRAPPVSIFTCFTCSSGGRWVERSFDGTCRRWYCDTQCS